MTPPVFRRAPRWRLVSEGAVVIVLVALSVWLARAAFDHAAVVPDFHALSAAVGVATGHGFADPVPAVGGPLDLFLSGQAPAVSWADAQATEWREPDQMIQSIRYLTWAVGLVWAWTGISWSAVGLVAGALHGLMVVSTYFLLRFVAPVPLAALGAAWMAASTLSLKLVPHLRDYSKGAFIAAALPLVVALALRVTGRGGVMALAAATGVVAGVGIGFKMDVAVTLPLAATVIVVFRGRRPWTAILDKSLGVAALVLAFMAAAAPILIHMSSGGSNVAHVTMLGWAAPFDSALGVERSLYSILPFYSDDYVARVIEVASGGPLQFTSPDYDRAGMALWLEVARSFPADIAIRALAAANGALNLAFQNPDPTFVTQPLPAAAITTPAFEWMSQWNGWGAWVGIGFVAVAAWQSVRRGLLAAFLVLVVGGYPFLQYGDRHYFHTQVVAVVALLGMARALAQVLWMAARQQPVLLCAGARRVLVVAAVMAIAVMGPVTALRVYQSGSLSRELVRFQRNALTKMMLEVAEGESGGAQVRWPEPAGVAAAGSAAVHSAYYLVEFFVDEPGGPLLVGVHYESRTAAHDYSRVLTLRPKRGVNLVGFPAVSVPGFSAFAGLELGPAARRAFSSVYLVPAGPAGLPIDITLPADWRDHALYQRLRLEPGAPRLGPSITCAGLAGCGPLLGYLEAVGQDAHTPGSDDVNIFHADIAQATPQGIVVDGVVENDSAYLVQLKDWDSAGRGAFVVGGHLRHGGVAIGMLKDRRWYKQVFVTEPGDFQVALSIDEPGTYQPLITAAMPPGQRLNQVQFTKMALLPAAIAP